MPTEPKLADANWAPSQPKCEPCRVCGRPQDQGQHYVRAPKGLKCTAPGCGKTLFERCFGADGEVVATRCLGANHRVLVGT